MADLLIRNVDDGDVKSLDQLASRMGISRSELLRRQAHSLAQRSSVPMVQDDLDRSTELFADALDDEVMERAWR